MRLRIATVLVAALVAGACGGTHPHHHVATGPPPGPTSTSTSSTTSTTVPAPRVKVAGAALTPFDSCGSFLSAVRSEAAAEVTPWGLPSWMGGGGFRGGAPVPMTATGAAAGAPSGASPQSAAAAPASSSSSDSAAFSTTNNQEAGVDEADTAKTDGHLLVSLRYGGPGQELQIVDVASSPPRLRGTISLPNGSASGLFLLGSEAIVIGRSSPSGVYYPASGAYPSDAYPQSQAAQTQMWVVGLSDPDHPTVARTFSVSGTEVASRLVGHSVKLVVSSSPTVVFPQPGPAPADQAAALKTNRAIIAHAPLNAWLPTVTDAAGHQHVADCAAVQHPVERSGVATLSVVSIDPDQSQPGPAVTVLGDPGTVYASTTDLYVATSSFAEQQAAVQGQSVPDERTLIHQFDITNPQRATYRGSGAVAGELLNQYALSEFNGDLRVATTTGTPSPPPFEGSPVPAADGSQSIVTVLRPAGGALVPVGEVAGLGRTERIYGVRFVGPLGYVVTFRQMDPLYIVDLTNPAAPAVRGSLELTGYSAYLHPVGDGRLLGVGASANSNGQRTGLQVSLFDVANPAKPGLLGQSSMPNAHAGVENDPHAFLWWQPTGLVVLPVQQCCSYDSSSSSSQFVGAVAYQVSGSSVHEVGRISQPSPSPSPPPQPQPYPGPPSGKSTPPAPPSSSGSAGSAGPSGSSGSSSGAAGPAIAPYYPGAQIERAFVIGDRIWTVSQQGVLASDLHTFAQVSWLPFSS